MKLRLTLLLTLAASCNSFLLRAYTATDSLILERVFSYMQHHGQQVDGFASNVYTKHTYYTHKRNAALLAIPTMYSLARGQRTFISEHYSRIYFRDVNDYDNLQQLVCGTIPRHRQTMSPVRDFLTPSLYSPTMYEDHILSPFHRNNRVFYRYSTALLQGQKARLYFHPRYVTNTQLVSGRATINIGTGQIEQVELEGEFDMIHFRTLSMLGESGPKALLPRWSKTEIIFKFMGNHITSEFEAVFNCPVTLPDTLSLRGDRVMMDSIRPISLSADEQAIYDHYDSLHAPVPTVVAVNSLAEKPRRRQNLLKHIGWDLIGENLIRSLKTQSEAGYVKLSPIINPQYISYSHRKGLSYKFKLGASYRLGTNANLEVNPQLGYNFKLKKFYFTVPARINYNIPRDAYVSIVWGNGNRISNSSILDELIQDDVDPQLLEGRDLDTFDDNRLSITHNIAPLKWLGIEAGLVFHRRTAANPSAMKQLNMPTVYKSLAPMIGLKLRPSAKAPIFSIDWERGLSNHKNDFLSYERWEFDASMKHRMTRMQTLNLRIGGGFYSFKDKNYFMDFSNFRDENLPEGWDDDWSGQFQLLSARLYNASNYYARSNISFESPMLLASFLPFVGRYVERERTYISTLLIDKHRPYSELGWGFTCRYFSIGAFASFAGIEYQEFGCKFTFELFRRW